MSSTCHPVTPPDSALLAAGEWPGDATILANGRVILADYLASDLRLGHPVDMVSHPTLPIVYVADARYGGGDNERRCKATGPHRGVHVVRVDGEAVAKELQGPDARLPDVSAIRLPEPPKDLSGDPHACDDHSMPKDGAFGLAITSDGKSLFASTGISGYVLRFSLDRAGLIEDGKTRSVQIGGFTAGLALSPDESSLFVVRFLGVRGAAASSVAEIDLTTSIHDATAADFSAGSSTYFSLLDNELKLDGFGAYNCLATPEPNSGIRLWVSGFRDGSVQTAARWGRPGDPFCDLRGGPFCSQPSPKPADPPQYVESMNVGKNPEGLARFGDSVVVAVSDADKLVQLRHVPAFGIERVGPDIPLGGYLCDNCAGLLGASPSQLSVDGNRAYVALAMDEALAIVDLERRLPLGVINVGIDPSAVSVVRGTEGQRWIAVANGKTAYGPNCPLGGCPSTTTVSDVAGEASQLTACWNEEGAAPQLIGTVQCGQNGPMPRPDIDALVDFDPAREDGTLAIFVDPAPPGQPTTEVLRDHTAAARQRISNPVGAYDPQCANDTIFPIPPPNGHTLTPIRHVVLVVRENKTYDFLLGDLPAAATGRPRNGSPGLAVDQIRAQHGWPAITPNLHRLAERFTSLDNFYDDAEVSLQGHSWSTNIFVNDYLERIHLEESSAKAFFNYQFEQEAAFSAAEPGFGSFFEHLLKRGIPFRVYGEGIGLLGHVGDDYVANHADLHLMPQDQDSSDIDKVNKILEKLGNAEDWPAFTYILLPRDHTKGLTPGQLSPVSLIAENDVATGQLVQRISANAELWKSTAIFIVEDDSQQGYDHVDYHRSICLVVSPWAKPSHNSSVHASYPALYRTIEAILGIDPINRLDRYAPILWDAFTADPDPSAFAPFKAECHRVPLDARNPAACGGTGAASSTLSGSEAGTGSAAQSPISDPDDVEIDERPDIDRIVWDVVTGSNLGDGRTEE